MLRVCDPDHGPDLVEFIIYRPDKPIPVETTFKDLFNPCKCKTPICAMKTSYEKVKMKYEKRRKSYPVEKTRRTSVPCLTAHNPERGKIIVLLKAFLTQSIMGFSKNLFINRPRGYRLIFV